MKRYKITFINAIQDSVHGLIQLTKVEDAIEKTPLFKRLQDIRQLGLVNRIYPGATYTRYAHSLGVMHIADQMAQKLKFDDDSRQVLRLAGLLHDIGHYPLSHDLQTVFEQVFSYPEKGNEQDKSNSEDLDGNFNSAYHHERIGANLLSMSSSIKKAILQEYLKETTFLETTEPNNDLLRINTLIEIINHVITGKYKPLEITPTKLKVTEDGLHPTCLVTKNIPLMIQIMHSELDADNMDYMIRDSQYSGTTFGSLNLQRIVSELETCDITYDDELVGKTNIPILGVTKKGISSVDQYFINKYFHYRDVVFHKYVVIIGKSLQYLSIGAILLEKENVVKTIDQIMKTNRPEEQIKEILNYFQSLEECEEANHFELSTPESICSRCKSAITYFEILCGLIYFTNYQKPPQLTDEQKETIEEFFYKYVVDNRFLEALYTLSNCCDSPLLKKYKDARLVGEKMIKREAFELNECKFISDKKDREQLIRGPKYKNVIKQTDNKKMYPLEMNDAYYLSRHLTNQKTIEERNEVPTTDGKGKENGNGNVNNIKINLYQCLNGVPIIEGAMPKDIKDVRLIVDDERSLMSILKGYEYSTRNSYIISS